MTTDDTPSADGGANKLMRDALIRELRSEGEHDGVVTEKLRHVARKLVEKAIGGDISAIKEIFDRLDGKSVAGATAADEGPKKVIIQWKNRKSLSSLSTTKRASNSSASTTESSASPAS